jgi:hypothetical protein
MEEIVDSTDIILQRRISREEYERIPWHRRKQLERSGAVITTAVPEPKPVEVKAERKRRVKANDEAISRCGRCGAWMLIDCRTGHDSESD